MDPALDDVAFLVGSTTRVRLLKLLRAEPYDQASLRAEVGVSPLTMRRTLGAMAERGWIRETADVYEVTPLGELILPAFDDLTATMETIRSVRDVAAYLPFEAFDFDLDRFTNAEVVQLSARNALEAFHRLSETVTTAERLQVLTSVVGPAQVKAIRDGFVGAPDRTVSIVLTESAYETAEGDREIRQWLYELATTGCECAVYEEAIPCGIVLTDNTVILEPYDEHGEVPAVITTDDGAITKWAEATYGRIEGKAAALDPVAFESTS